jgi:hypothetical protein
MSLQNPKADCGGGPKNNYEREFEFFMHLGSGNSIYLTRN